MVKFYTIGEIEHFAKNDPTVIADGDTINGYLFNIGSDGKADLPATTKELWVAMNEFHDDRNGMLNAKIKDGERINGYRVRELDGMYLEVTESNIVTTMASIAVGDVLIADSSTGKFKEDSATAGDPSFKVVELRQYGAEKGVLVQVIGSTPS